MGYLLIVVIVLLLVGQRTLNAPDTGPPGVRLFAEAIARAEGWYVYDSLCQRRNNPGSISDANGLIQYSTPEAGWSALYLQIQRMVSGSSSMYSPTMTLYEAAITYTGNDKPEAWARIVSGQLGVTTDTPIGELV